MNKCFYCGQSGATGSDTHDRDHHQHGDVNTGALALIPNWVGGAAVHQLDGTIVAEFHGCREVAEAHAKRFLDAFKADPATAIIHARVILRAAIEDEFHEKSLFDAITAAIAKLDGATK